MESHSVSVIIPAYNAERTIVKCIQSVFNQSLSVSEVIVVDDGSVDRTRLIVEEYISKHKTKNLIIETQINSGPSKARNVGVRLSKGEWIAFLDADDTWMPNKIEKQIGFSHSHPEFSLIGTLMKSKKGIRSSDFNVVTFESLLYSNSFFTSTVLIRRSIFEKYYFDEAQKYSEDYKLWLLITRFSKSAVLLDELVVYNDQNERGNSLSGQLWKMETNELKNYLYLYKINFISIITLFLISLYSFLKYIRRLIFKCLIG